MVWLAGWGYRKSHLITASAGAGTNYQVGIKVYKTTGTDNTEVVNGITMGKVYVGSYCRDDFGDIRFTDNDGDTLLDCWMETSTSGVSAIFWVEVADTLESNATIYVYYSKSDATYPYLADDTAQGTATFLFFDHFLGTVLDTTKWDNTNVTVTVASSIAYFKKSTSGWGYVSSKNTFGPNVSMISKEHVGVKYGGTYGSGHGFKTSNGSVDYIQIYYDATNRFTSGKNSVDLTDNSITIPSAYTNIEFQWVTTCSHFQDGVQKGTTHSATYTPIVALKNEIAVYAMDWYVDWTLIRKFVSPEPAHSTWGDRESFYHITGVTRNSAGVILGSCTVLLYKTSDHSYVTSMTSDADTGEYSFALDNSTEYFVVAFKSGTPNVQGVTDDDLVGA